MAKSIAAELSEFLKQEMKVNCQIMFHVDSTHLVCDDLPFDIYLYQRINPYHSINHTKKAIFLSSGQLREQFTKITQRIKVLAGKANRIFARQTVASRLDKKIANAFLLEHHLQIPLPGKYRYGLYSDGELVSIATFSGARRMRQKHSDYRSFELLRFCHKKDVLVVGGLSKLIKRFTLDFQPDDIMTYVDLDWSQESSLSSLGFKEEGRITGLSYWIAAHQQFQVANSEALRQIKATHPCGYWVDNAGSIKMLKYLHKQV